MNEKEQQYFISIEQFKPQDKKRCINEIPDLAETWTTKLGGKIKLYKEIYLTCFIWIGVTSDGSQEVL